MSARLALYGLLWRAALAQVHPYAHRIALWLTPAAALAAVVFAMDAHDAATALRWGCNMLFGAALLTLAWGYLPGAFKLNTPANAQLTPGMRARLLELGTAVWLLCIVGIAAANAGSASTISLPVVWFMVASLGMGLAATGSSAGAVVMIAIWPLMGLPSFVPETVRAMMAHAAFLPLVAAVLVLPGLATMRAILPQGGDRHWRLLSKPGLWRSKHTFGNYEGGRFMRWWQTRSLRRAASRRDLGGMLLHGAGPGLQAGGIVLAIGAVGLLGLALMGLVHMSRDPAAGAWVEKTGWMWSLMPLVLFQLHAMLLAGMSDKPAGQPLLRLAPAMPATAPRFNRLLASTLLRSCLVVWAIAASAAFLHSALSGADADGLVATASVCCLALPVLVLPLRDHARRPISNSVLQWLLALAISGACLLLAIPVARLAILPVLPTGAGLAVVLTALLVSRNYRAMLRAPFAFPAGRLD
ncbi:hypothetical protein SOM61_03605 [Massilia sp. CFBP9012]|uniref:hypothetical protein n=1 Tax=Massilia sp. CFBP9012 TaxID=3096531 RepID=UPI002A6A9817|nr:hypothetical protein [Massilia sp. CFBP9012]MDY0974038.1 hypothetical protein [Massilia sp. CFBP9012]